MLWVSVGGLKRGVNKRTLDSVEENIAEQRSKIHQPVEQKISTGGLIQDNEKEGQEYTVDVEEELASKRDHAEQRQRKQKIRKEQEVLKKAEGELNKDEERRKKQGKGDVRVKQMILGVLDEGENRKEMKARIIRDQTVTSVLEVKDEEVKGDLGPEIENAMTSLLGQYLAMLPVERKSDEAPGLLSGEDQRVRWWRKQGFY